MARIIFETEKFLIEEKGNGWYVLTIKKQAQQRHYA